MFPRTSRLRVETQHRGGPLMTQGARAPRSCQLLSEFSLGFYRSLYCAVTACLLVGCTGGEEKPLSEESKPFVFSHVTVIDTTGAPPKPNMTVVITGDRIAALGKAGTVTIPNDAEIIDAAGKYLIPGLLDMHAHLQEMEPLFPLFIANGVTGVREMGGGPHERINRWREQVASETLLGPRILLAGQIVSGPEPAFPGALRVGNIAEAKQAVTSLRQRGVDFLKVYSLLTRDEYFAIAEEAKKQGFPFAGHIPGWVSAAEASDAGQSTVEHLSGPAVLLGCSTREAELRKEAMEAIVKSDYSMASIAEYLLFGSVEILDTYSEEKAEALFARFVKNGTVHVPTLAGRRSDTAHFMAPDDSRWNSVKGESHFINDPYLKYIPPSIKKTWYNPYTGDFTAKEFAPVRRLYQKQLEIVGQMRRAGVKFMVGSDAGKPYSVPGFGLHQEMALFVEAGFTPMEALQSATLHPAEFLGRIDSFGTVAQGKIADLVLLEANPLDAIDNTQKIAAVVFRGKLFSKLSLQAMLDEVEAAGAPQVREGEGR